MNKDLPKTNIIIRVLLVKYGNSTGTAFTVEKNDKQFLISAKHVFDGISEDDEIEVFANNVWKRLKVKPIFCDDEKVDLIALDFGNKFITGVPPIEIGTRHTLLAQNAYFLGFPYGMFTDSGELNNKKPFPFIKKSIVSSINKEIIYLDGHNNRGFSGGPVTITNKDNKTQIIGVVSSYLGDSVNKTENSGIFVAYNISLIFDKL